jgi:hypothetical protein
MRTGAARSRPGNAARFSRRRRRAGSRVVHRVEPVVEGAAELGEEPDSSRRRYPAGESAGAPPDPLPGRAAHEACGRHRSSLPASIAKPSSSSRRTARSSRNGRLEDEARPPRDTVLEIRLSPCGSQRSPPSTGTAIELKVKSSSRGRPRSARQRREVDRALVAVAHHSRPVALREWERDLRSGARSDDGVPWLAQARRGRAPAGRGARPGSHRRRSTPLRRRDLTNPLIHRAPTAGPGGRCSGPSRSRSRWWLRRACSSIRIPSPTSATGVPRGSFSAARRRRVHRDRPDDRRRAPSTDTSVPVMSRLNPSAYPTGTMPIRSTARRRNSAVPRALPTASRLTSAVRVPAKRGLEADRRRIVTEGDPDAIPQRTASKRASGWSVPALFARCRVSFERVRRRTEALDLGRAEAGSLAEASDSSPR